VTSAAASVELVELAEFVELVELLSVAAWTIGTMSNKRIKLKITAFFFMIPPFLYLVS